VRDDEELTTQQAADLLNVSRPFVTKLLARGEIPFYRVGTHHRLYRSDVEAYRQTQAARARQAMREMVEQAEELGLYD
jgi:excisionase family DNA binding protein